MIYVQELYDLYIHLNDVIISIHIQDIICIYINEKYMYTKYIYDTVYPPTFFPAGILVSGVPPALDGCDPVRGSRDPPSQHHKSHGKSVGMSTVG